MLGEDVVVPFAAQMIVTGAAQGTSAHHQNKVQEGYVPGDVVEDYTKAIVGKNKKSKTVPKT